MAKQKIILFDIDYTLFDTAIYRSLLFPKLLFHIEQADNPKALEVLADKYYSHRERAGYFNLEYMIQEVLDELHLTQNASEIFQKLLLDETSYVSALYTEVIDVFKQLTKINGVQIGIFSAGRVDHQLAKIQSLEDFFHKEHIHIFTKKHIQIQKTLAKYPHETVYLVDDILEILAEAKQSHQDIITIWSKRGRYAHETESFSTFKPDYTITNLSDLLPVIKEKK